MRNLKFRARTPGTVGQHWSRRHAPPPVGHAKGNGHAAVAPDTIKCPVAHWLKPSQQSEVPREAPRDRSCDSGDVISCRVPATGALLQPSRRLSTSLQALDLLRAQAIDRYAGVPRSEILAIGLTAHTAPLGLRERLAVPESEWSRAAGELCGFPHIEEAAVLSTCNRMELYLVVRSWHLGAREAEEWLSCSSGVPLEQLQPHLFLLRNGDATQHLLRVASGLDSVVTGEGQILAQVKQVYKVGQSSICFGRQLSGLFKQAITAGKRVRSETSISTGGVSVSSAAAELGKLKLPSQDYVDARVCIIGAGKMSTLLVKHLLSKGCKRVTLLNRSLPRCQALQEEFPDMEFDVHLMPDLLACVEDSDVVFAASGSEELLIVKAHAAAMRPASDGVGGVRRFIDISVPRNIAADVSDVPGNIVYNVDDLKEVVAGNKEARAQAAAEAEVLLREEQRSFEAWRDSLDMVPTIKALRSKAESIRTAEVLRAAARLSAQRSKGSCCGAASSEDSDQPEAHQSALSRAERAVLEDMSHAIINKLLHGPMAALRSGDFTQAATGSGATSIRMESNLEDVLQCMRLMERVFELEPVMAAQQRLVAAPPGTQGGASSSTAALQA